MKTHNQNICPSQFDNIDLSKSIHEKKQNRKFYPRHLKILLRSSFLKRLCLYNQTTEKKIDYLNPIFSKYILTYEKNDTHKWATQLYELYHEIYKGNPKVIKGIHPPFTKWFTNLYLKFWPSSIKQNFFLEREITASACNFNIWETEARGRYGYGVARWFTR